MLLALDVGNTNITIGLFRKSRLVRRGRVPTHGSSYIKALGGLLRRFKIAPVSVDGVIVSSVVPKATLVLKSALKKLVKPRLLILGENVKAPIRNRYRIPRQVGQDRLVNGVAAWVLYGGPTIVVDFGTAITIDLISEKQEYLGGLIAPGVEIALEALSSRAALLPKIRLARPRELLGRDTVNSMRAGIFYGYGSLCDGIVRRLKARYAPQAKVVATGGNVSLIAPFCRTIRVINPDLTLQGLQIIFSKESLSR